MSTRQWAAILLVAAVAGALAFGITRALPCRPRGSELDRLQNVSFLRRELQLTDAQTAQVRALHAELATQLADCCARHCGARMRLGRALADETNDHAGTESALAEMCRAYEESERTALGHVRQLRALLDREQRHRFDALLAGCLCRSCPGCRGPGDHPNTEGQEP